MKRFLLLSVYVVTSITVAGQVQTERPNILWIVSEDNTTLLGCYGDKFATTPNLDKLASEGVLYKNAFASAPVCAPSRNTLITGMYPTALGTEHMRSVYAVPDFVKFFPRYLREAGYYTSNNAKKDYNTIDQIETWDESSDVATYKKRKPGQPFFAVFNLGVSHESSLHKPVDTLQHDPKKVPIPSYHPRTKEFKHDWAQYYDKLEIMDRQVADLLNELKDQGLDENTIVFYYSDNGGVLARSKRFMYESGLHVPLIIRFPKKYSALLPVKAGTQTDQIVSFVDFAPTVLSLAGVKVPDYMQGRAFLGSQKKVPREYAFSFRGRMDERIDMIRSVRDKKYRYIRNYMPHKIYGENVSYLWLAPSVRSWETEYKAGRLNETQSKFWSPKPAEELYAIETDPDNINNLATDPKFRKTLIRLREANLQWIKENKDAGFIPEAKLFEIAKKNFIYMYVRDEKIPIDRITETAEMASSRDGKYLDEIIKRLADADPSVRYWAATGCTILRDKSARDALIKLLSDSEVFVRIASAEALYQIGEREESINALNEALKSENAFSRLQALNVLQTLGEHGESTIELAKKLIPSDLKEYGYDARAAKTLIDTNSK